MEKIRLGKTEIMASKTAFGALPIMRITMEEAKRLLLTAYEGGINYFDTARQYTDSEEKIGNALSDMRKNIFLATKSHHFTVTEMKVDLDISLKNLKTDYIDVYQLHNPSFCPKPDGEDGIYNFLSEAKKAGKIRHIAITNHRPHVAKEAIESGLYEVLQFPFAYISSPSEFEIKDLCLKADMGFVAMKPFGGGVLQSGAAVYSFFAEQKGVLPIYGMQHMEELTEMLGYLKNPPNPKDVEEIIEKDKKELTGNFCRNCGYCAPCPVGIAVDAVCRSYYNLRRMPASMMINDNWKKMMEDTVNCIHCGSCSKKCPYELDPPSRFEFLRNDYMEYYNRHQNALK